MNENKTLDYDPYDAEDRKELLEILDKQYKEAREIIENGKAIPNHMSCNFQRTGVTIHLRKLYPIPDEEDQEAEDDVT